MNTSKIGYAGALKVILEKVMSIHNKKKWIKRNQTILFTSLAFFNSLVWLIMILFKLYPAIKILLTIGFLLISIFGIWYVNKLIKKAKNDNYVDNNILINEHSEDNLKDKNLEEIESWMIENKILSKKYRQNNLIISNLIYCYEKKCKNKHISFVNANMGAIALFILASLLENPSIMNLIIYLAVFVISYMLCALYTDYRNSPLYKYNIVIDYLMLLRYKNNIMDIEQ